MGRPSRFKERTCSACTMIVPGYSLPLHPVILQSVATEGGLHEILILTLLRNVGHNQLQCLLLRPSNPSHPFHVSSVSYPQRCYVQCLGGLPNLGRCHFSSGNYMLNCRFVDAQRLRFTGQVPTAQLPISFRASRSGSLAQYLALVTGNRASVIRLHSGFGRVTRVTRVVTGQATRRGVGSGQGLTRRVVLNTGSGYRLYARDKWTSSRVVL